MLAIKSWSMLNEHSAATTVLNPPVKQRLSSIDLAWCDSFAAESLFSSLSDPYLHISSSDSCWLPSWCHSPCTTQRQADKTQRLSLRPLSISFCYSPHSPTSPPRPSGCCEGNLNHLSLMLSVTGILEVNNYCLRLIVLVGRREIGCCSISRLCIGVELVLGSF